MTDIITSLAFPFFLCFRTCGIWWFLRRPLSTSY